MTFRDQLREDADQMASVLQENRDSYYLVSKIEPVLELIESGTAWTVEGRYGATLVTRNLAIWDVDSVKGFSFPEAPIESDPAVLAVMEASLKKVRLEHQLEWLCFRVYRTFAGVRVICTNRKVEPTCFGELPSWFGAVGEALNADPRYMAISRKQVASRARLVPKPIQHRDHFQTLEQERYTLGEKANLRCCRFIGVVGDDTSDDLAAQITFHDDQTNAVGCDWELF